MRLARLIVACFMAGFLASGATRLRSPKDQPTTPMKRKVVPAPVAPATTMRLPLSSRIVVRPPPPPLSLVWLPVDGAMGYNIWIGDKPGGNYTNTVDAGNSNSFSIIIPRGVSYLAINAYGHQDEMPGPLTEITNGLPLHPNKVVMVWQYATNLLWIATNPTPVSQFWTGRNYSISMTNF